MYRRSVADMVKNALISVLCGFIGAGLFLHLKPPKTLVTQFAVVDLSNPDGSIKSPQEIAIINARAKSLSDKGFVVLNKSGVYDAPSEIFISGKLKSE